MSSPLSDRVLAYTRSIDVDLRLGIDDVDGSLAHAAMLHEVSLIDDNDHEAIAGGLNRIRGELEQETFAVAAHDEDVHSAIERRLHELVGEPALRLHTGRSRNDQVATDLRLYVRRETQTLIDAVRALQQTLRQRCDEHGATAMPGYTHLQRAQPVTLGLHLGAYVEMLERDAGRLSDARRRSDLLPLGSGALAGSTLPLDRESVRRQLGFAGVTANSMDAVSDRDFVVEVVFACALLMVHLSRLGEELVLWSSTEFGFVALDDSHATGSSMMPQKKNPDVAELGRGRSGRVIADVVSLLTLLKGLPLTYNRDLQEDKRALFDALDTTRETVIVLAEVMGAVTFREDVMRAAASDPQLRATAIAEYLVTKGMAFREAHRAVAEMVQRTESEGRSLDDVTLAEWQQAVPTADEGLTALLS
jgi:argininosuccinate lyase